MSSIVNEETFEEPIDQRLISHKEGLNARAF